MVHICSIYTLQVVFDIIHEGGESLMAELPYVCRQHFLIIPSMFVYDFGNFSAACYMFVIASF